MYAHNACWCYFPKSPKIVNFVDGYAFIEH